MGTKTKKEICLIRVEKKTLEEFEDFLESKGIEVSKSFAFNLAVNSFIKNHKENPITLSD